jgi:hypothetical protein
VSVETDAGDKTKVVSKPSVNNVSTVDKTDNEKEQVVPEKTDRLDLEEVDEDMLADCINIGIQDNR